MLNFPPIVVFFTPDDVDPEPDAELVITEVVEVVTVHVPVPEQAPVQPSNTEFGPGVAARVTVVPET